MLRVVSRGRIPTFAPSQFVVVRHASNPGDDDDDEFDDIPERDVAFPIKEMRDVYTPLEIRKATREARGLWKEIPSIPEGFKPSDVVQDEDLSYDEEYFYMNPSDQYDQELVQERREAFLRPKPNTYAPDGWEYDIEAWQRHVRDGVVKRSERKGKKADAGATQKDDQYDLTTMMSDEDGDEHQNSALLPSGNTDQPMETTAFGTLVSVMNPRLLQRRKMGVDSPFPEEYSDAERMEQEVLRQGSDEAQNLAKKLDENRQALRRLSLQMRVMMKALPTPPRDLNFDKRDTLDAGKQAASYGEETFSGERLFLNPASIVDPKRVGRAHVQYAKRTMERLMGDMALAQSRGTSVPTVERRMMPLPNRIVDGMLMFSDDVDAMVAGEKALDSHFEEAAGGPKKTPAAAALQARGQGRGQAPGGEPGKPAQQAQGRDRLNQAFRNLLATHMDKDKAFSAKAGAKAGAEDSGDSSVNPEVVQAVHEDGTVAKEDEDESTAAEASSGQEQSEEVPDADFVVPGSTVVEPEVKKRVVGHRINWDKYMSGVQEVEDAELTRADLEEVIAQFDAEGVFPLDALVMVGDSVGTGSLEQTDVEWLATELARRVIASCEAIHIELGDQHSEVLMVSGLLDTIKSYEVVKSQIRERNRLREKYRRDREERIAVLASTGKDADADGGDEWIKNTPPEILSQPKLVNLIDPKSFVGVTDGGELGDDPVGVFMSQLRDFRDIPEDQMQAALGINMPSDKTFFGGVKVGQQLRVDETEAAALARAHEDLYSQISNMRMPMQPRLRNVDRSGASRAVGRRKTATAQAKLAPGTGEFTVNGQPLAIYFKNTSDRQSATLPLLVSNTAGVFDIHCTAQGGGMSGQAGAVKLAISRALQNFDPRLRPVLKKHGFMKRDPRMKEEKKAGQPKARAKKQWNRR